MPLARRSVDHVSETQLDDLAAATARTRTSRWRTGSAWPRGTTRRSGKPSPYPGRPDGECVKARASHAATARRRQGDVRSCRCGGCSSEHRSSSSVAIERHAVKPQWSRITADIVRRVRPRPATERDVQDRQGWTCCHAGTSSRRPRTKAALWVCRVELPSQ